MPNPQLIAQSHPLQISPISQPELPSFTGNASPPRLKNVRVVCGSEAQIWALATNVSCSAPYKSERSIKITNILHYLYYIYHEWNEKLGSTIMLRYFSHQKWYQ